MISKYKIEGLDCPNCAKKLEDAINKLEIVNNATIDFLKSTLIFETEDEQASFKEIVKIMKVVEPEARLIKEKIQVKKDKKIIIDIITLSLGFVLGLIALFVDMPTPLFWVIYISSAIILGYKTYIKAIKLLTKGMINENLLITLSIIGATCLKEYMEGLMVILLYTIGKLLESIAVNKSKKSIEAITKLAPEYATVLENGEEKRVVPSEVEIGNVIIVKAGERVALDGIVVDGHSNLNLQSLTGESLPVESKLNGEILSGSIVLDGVLKIKTTKKFSDSTVSRIMNLIENASEKKSKTETVISKIAKWYTLGVIILAVSVFGLVWIITKDVNLAVYRGLIFLLVSCPCAFAISVPLAYFSGLGNASKHGILIKGSNYLDACAKINTVAFDKTGTITTGEFDIEKVEIVDKTYLEEDIIYLASLGEQNSIHPLAKAILKANQKELREVSDFAELSGKGITFKYENNNYFVGRINATDNKGTVVEVHKNQKLLGKIILKDKIKDNSFTAISNLNEMGIKTMLLSGDNKDIVTEVANKVGIKEFKSNMLPEEKYNWIVKEKENKNTVLGYVGDGINDSPSLAVSDVGFSMGINGSQLSIEASDIVLVNDDLEKIPTAIKISKYTRKIVWQNIILSAGIKLLFLTLGAFGVTGMLEAVIADVGVTLMAILNSLRALKKKFKKNKLI